MAGDKLRELTERTERVVISAWFWDGKFRAAWQPEPDLFVFPGHRSMARLMAVRGPELDADSLVLELKRSGELKHWSDGAEGAEHVITGTPSTLDPWGELARLRELVALRKLRQGLQDALRIAETECSLAQAQATASEALSASMTSSGTTARTMREAFESALNEALDPSTKRAGIKTGCPALDEATGGYRPETVWVIGAKSNWGKSAWLVSGAQRARAQGVKPLIVYGEDPEGLYAKRWIAQLARIPAWRLRDGKLDAHHIHAAAEVVKQAEDWAMFYDAREKSVEHIAADIRSLVATHGCGIVFVDYLQTLKSSEPHETRRLEVYHMYQVLKRAIKASRAAGVIFSQVTEGDSGKLKVRDAEDVLIASEVTIFGRVEKEPMRDFSGKVIGERDHRFFFIDKVKDGPKGFRVDLEFNENFACFELDNDGQEPLPYAAE